MFKNSTTEALEMLVTLCHKNCYLKFLKHKPEVSNFDKREK